MTGSLQGFRTVVQQNITLTVGSQRVVDFELRSAQLEESITVQGAAAQVDVVSSAVTTTIEQKQIAELPLNGRNYSQLITLAPGVQSLPGTGNGIALRPAEPRVGLRRAAAGAGVSCSTTRTSQGFWNRAAGSGVLGTTLGVEAIAEFQTC